MAFVDNCLVCKKQRFVYFAFDIHHERSAELWCHECIKKNERNVMNKEEFKTKIKEGNFSIPVSLTYDEWTTVCTALRFYEITSTEDRVATELNRLYKVIRAQIVDDLLGQKKD